MFLNTTWRWGAIGIFGPVFNQKTFPERLIDFPKSYKQLVVSFKGRTTNCKYNDAFQLLLVFEARLNVFEVFFIENMKISNNSSIIMV